jgi:DUF4097 and DUF4098 domain-containing protein YvlB
MRYKWWIVGVLSMAELSLLAAIVVAGRGVSLQSLFIPNWFSLSDNPSMATSDMDQTFPVGAAASLDVQDTFGSISVTTGSGNAIMVHVHKVGRGPSPAIAGDALKALQVSLTQNGNAVTLKAELPNPGIALGPVRQAEADFTIEVPAEAAVTAHTDFGDVRVNGALGGVDAASSNGLVDAQAVGGAVKLHSDFGAITLENATVTTVGAASSNGAVTLSQVTAGGAVDLRSDFGAVKFDGGRAAGLTAQTENGNVTLNALTVDGAASARSSFGAVTLTQVAARSYAANSTNGRVSIDGAGGGGADTAVQAGSDFGSVSVVHASGATLDLHSSNGSVSFSGSLGAGASSLTSDFGDVKLALPSNTNAQVDLATSFGGIHSALPITASGTMDKGHWTGTLGAGGPRLTVKTSNGSISIDALGS